MASALCSAIMHRPVLSAVTSYDPTVWSYGEWIFHKVSAAALQTTRAHMELKQMIPSKLIHNLII